MRTITTIAGMQSEARSLRDAGKRIGFVPTMGYLHEGHLSLVREARRVSDVVVMSIFVNPAQFAPTEDFARYPRDIERDTSLAAGSGVDLLFVPSTGEMYPEGFRTAVEVAQLSSVWEGKIRPTHFKGVATVVLKLFNIVKPAAAVFGQKDIQQAVILKRMVKDLNIDVEIIVAPIVREADGLAMSSRNVYLSSEERRQALVLHRALDEAEKLIRSGERDRAGIRKKVTAVISTAPLASVDYIALMGDESLEEIRKLEDGGNYILALAVRFGATRLIDNTRIHVS